MSSLVNLYEFSIERGTVYPMWMTTRLAAIFIKDDDTHCSQYRPVSLLSVPSKITESEINSNIVQHIILKRTSVQKSNKNEIFMARVKNSNCLNFCTQVDPSEKRKTVYIFFLKCVFIF